MLVGQANPQPGMPDTAWIRRAVPTEDTNRSRWPTHPAWRIVQAAPFTPLPEEVRQLMRVEQQNHDIDRRVRVMYGALVSATALAVPHGEGWDVSKALAAIAPLLVEESEVAGKEFGGLVRDRKRRFHLPVQAWDKVLPKRPMAAQEEQPDPKELDQEPVGHLERAWWRIEMAERRMHEVARPS